MTFQRRTAQRIAALVRRLRPQATIVVGGYDPSLAPEVYEDPAWGVDVIVRGEGDITFRELVRALEAGAPLSDSDGSVVPRRRYASAERRLVRSARSTGEDGARCRTARRACSAATRSSAARSTSSRPRAAARSTAASARSSRCADATSTRWSIERVLADIADARARGARAIFIVDDNITLNVARFEALCRAIIDAGLNDIDYIVQAMTSSIASAGRDAGAADAEGRIPLRVPRHREHPRRRSGVPAGARQERGARERPACRQRHGSGDRRSSIGTACTSSAG